MGGIFSPAAQMVGWPQQQNTAPVVIAAPTGTAGPQAPPTSAPQPIGVAIDATETPEERARRLARLNSVLGSSDGAGNSGDSGASAGDGGGGAAAP